MVEVCLDCLNKIGNTRFKKRHAKLEFALCGGCGEYKKCIVFLKPKAVKAFAKRAIKKDARAGRPDF